MAYVIGVAQPVSIHIDTKGTAEVFDEAILEAVKQTFDFRPGAIIERFDLRRPIYSQVSCYGHFGREDLDLPWEQLDLKDDLLKHI